jgi:hypothetical protein
LVDNAVAANVELQVASLKASEVLGPFVASGRLGIARARYDLDSGTVDFFTR